MKKPRIAVALGMIVLAIPALALAATPKKGATYVGTRGGGAKSIQKKLSLKVSGSGKTLTINLYCGTGRAPDTVRKVAISKGHFQYRKHTGSVTEWTLKGHFTSATKATALFNNVVFCDGKSDGNIALSLKTTPSY